MASYGRAARTYDVQTQAQSLKALAKLIQRNSIEPDVRATAKRLVQECASRDDYCELQAIFDAVKHGNPNVPPLQKGLKYVADPRYSDYFTGARDILHDLNKGANGGDCDDHTSLVASLLASLGWKVGARAWGPAGTNELVHVYAVVAFPKRPPYTDALGLDTTVEESTVGWEPPPGTVLTAWLD